MESINDVKSIIYEFLPFKAKFAYAATETAVLSIHRAAKLKVYVKNYPLVDISTLRRIYDTYIVTNAAAVAAELVNRSAMPLDELEYEQQDIRVYDMINVNYINDLPLAFIRLFWQQQENYNDGITTDYEMNDYLAANPDYIDDFTALSNFANGLNYEAPHILFADNEDSDDWFVVPKDHFINAAIADFDILAVELLMKFYSVTGATFTIDKSNYQHIYNVVTKYIHVDILNNKYSASNVDFKQFVYIFLCSMVNNSECVSMLKAVISELSEYFFHLDLPQRLHLIELYDGIDYEISNEFLKDYVNFSTTILSALLAPIYAPETFIRAYNLQDHSMLNMLKLSYMAQIDVLKYAVLNKKTDLIKAFLEVDRELSRDDRVFKAAISAVSFETMRLLIDLGRLPQTDPIDTEYSFVKDPLIKPVELSPESLEFEQLFLTGVFNRAAVFESRAVEALYIQFSRIINDTKN